MFPHVPNTTFLHSQRKRNDPRYVPKEMEAVAIRAAQQMVARDKSGVVVDKAALRLNFQRHFNAQKATPQGKLARAGEQPAVSKARCKDSTASTDDGSRPSSTTTTSWTSARSHAWKQDDKEDDARDGKTAASTSH